jgi:hypothetical protein
MRIRAALILFIACAGFVEAVDPELTQRAKKEEQHSCFACHSLRIIESQRLSTAAWEKEINKMIGWGAVVNDRKLLLDYLSQEYSTAKPAPPLEFTKPSSK